MVDAATSLGGGGGSRKYKLPKKVVLEEEAAVKDKLQEKRVLAGDNQLLNEV